MPSDSTGDQETPDPQFSLSKVPNDPRSEEELLRNLVRAHPIELEEPVGRGMDTPLIIECACPGWQPREWPPLDAYPEAPPNYEEGGVRYPAVPCTVEEQVNEIVTAVDRGCAASHIHPRDPEDCLASHEVGLLKEVYDAIFERTDVLSLQHSWIKTDDGIDYVGPARERLEAANGSNKYVQGALVLWPPTDSYPADYGEDARQGIEFYKQNGIKPINKVRSAYDQRKLYREVFEPGLIEDDPDDPPVIINEMGHPFGWPVDMEPWMPIEVTTYVQQARERFPDSSLIGVYTGSRNWLPTTLTAILAGVDMVRIGIEDAYWMYPHREEVIQRNIDIVNKVVGFCETIGREVATPRQARDMLGIELT